MRSLFPNKKVLNDEELLIRYREKGDSDALGILFDRYLHLIYGLCLKYLKNREESQDAVMDIYEGLAEKLKSLEVSYFKSWLYIVSKNHCLMLLRKSGQNQTSLDENMESELVLHLNEYDSIEDDYTALEECIEQLKMDQKKCVNLFFMNKMSYEQIAIQNKMELNQVKSYIQNGKRNLKICLESKNVKR